ncbi:MAG: DUF423 domain-containing protein [Chloroflexi bacterium]|nr:DUF423 domain-containing protein [Chloroflexota bacterium]
MARRLVLLAAGLALIGVALGAFGLHALALLGTAWVAERWPGRWARWAGWLFVAGIILFSGSLYLLAIFDLGIMGAVAPVGGAAFLAGWACLGLAVWQGGQRAT